MGQRRKSDIKAKRPTSLSLPGVIPVQVGNVSGASLPPLGSSPKTTFAGVYPAGASHVSCTARNTWSAVAWNCFSVPERRRVQSSAPFPLGAVK